MDAILGRTHFRFHGGPMKVASIFRMVATSTFFLRFGRKSISHNPQGGRTLRPREWNNIDDQFEL